LLWLSLSLSSIIAVYFGAVELPRVLRTWCFVHFYFEVCFAPQRRALFQLLNLLCAPTVCNFWYLIWPNGSAPAAFARLIGKKTVFRDFSTFPRTLILFLLTLSLL
jgi:hypothetical protein